jgi:hypothetical protein
MPVFNAAPFLDVSVGSVLAQTCPHWELILVNDGSSDDSPQRCAEFARTHANIRYVTQENAGPAAARNTGMRLACGEFIFFLDADDRLPPDALRDLLAVADAYDADMVLGNFMKQENDAPPVAQEAIFAPGGEPFKGDIRVLAGGDLLDYLRLFLNYPSNHLIVCHWARLYRRARIIEHELLVDTNMRLFEDLTFNLAFLGKVKRLVFVNRPVYVYILRTWHPSVSMTSGFDAARLTSDMCAFCRSVDDFLLDLGVTGTDAERVRCETRHALIHFAIVMIVRSCWQWYVGNRAGLYQQLHAFVSAPVLRASLSSYTPRPGNSRLLPLLMRLKWVRLLAVIAKRKGQRRYGKEKTPSHEV